MIVATELTLDMQHDLIIEEAKVYSNPLSETEMKKEAEAEELEKKKKEQDVSSVCYIWTNINLELEWSRSMV